MVHERLRGLGTFAVVGAVIYGALQLPVSTKSTEAEIQSSATVRDLLATEKQKRTAPEEARLAMAAAKENFVLKHFRWSSDIGIMTATFTFDNRNEFDVKDVKVRCDHSAPSGTRIDSNTRTIYEVFKAKAQRTIKDFNMGFIHSQAKKSGCYVRELVIGEKREAKAR
jgi:hypothetical protein